MPDGGNFQKEIFCVMWHVKLTDWVLEDLYYSLGFPDKITLYPAKKCGPTCQCVFK